MPSQALMGPTLGEQLEGRGNNFGLMRLAAALVVVLSHSHPLSGREPPLAIYYFIHNPYLGNYAVSSFFVLSGLLVTRSFLSGRQSLSRYVAARVLRLYPALLCGVLLSIALGTLCNANPAAVTLADPHTWTYLWKNATALEFVAPLPGSFPSNAIAGGPNGSLWTLPIELRMYVWVGILGALGLLAHAWLGAFVLGAAIVALAINPFTFPEWLLVENWHAIVAAEFMAGMLAYLLRDWLRLSIPLALALVAVDVAVSLAGGYDAGRLVFSCCLPYWLLVLCCHPALPLVRLPGDYSYGVYLYAFPLQQTIACFWPGLAMGATIALSFALILATAVLSWHALEAPMLRRKPAA